MVLRQSGVLLRVCSALCVLLSPAVMWAGGPQSEAPRSSGVVKYVGPGSCSATACHGSITPRRQTDISQNEYSIWAAQDKHAKAYDVLTRPVAQRMAKILGLPAANTAERCLVCHALYVPEQQRARQFDISEGVSCESCHGGASEWLGPHVTAKKERVSDMYRLGMVNTEDLASRTQKCLTCHLGTAERNVDHELIAAGHPDLVFELASFQAVMPRHWKAEDPMEDAQAWSVGQAVQLREEMDRLTRRAKSKIWPEYAELDCFACHHSLTAAEDSWRQANGYKNRKPGNIPYNHSRYAVFKYVVHDVDPNIATQLDQQMNEVFRIVSQVNPSPEEAVSAAARVAQTTEQALERIRARKMDAPTTLRLVKAISGDADNIAFQDERIAEQAAMALDSLYLAYTKASGASSQDARNEINALFPLLERPSAYDPRKFSAQLRRVNGAIR